VWPPSGIGGVLAITLTLAACAGVSSADALLSEIEATGPKAVLDRLWTNAQFDAVCSEIETADPLWFEVARRLKGVSDAAASLSLNYCVARALPVAPARVLELVGHGFGLDDICTSPFIEPEPNVAERYEERAVTALARLRNSELAPLAERCVQAIRLPPR